MKPINNLTDIKNNYCLYLSSNIYDYALQLDLLKKNIQKKYKDINLKFALSQEIIKYFNLGDYFINLEELEQNKSNFGCCDELKVNPKTNPVESYCFENDIPVEIHKDKPYGDGVEVVVFTKSNGLGKDLSSMQIDKIKRIFGMTLKIDPDDFYTNPRGKFVIGQNCWQIFYAAYKKLPTFIISNKEGTTFFEKMFPLQKKLDL